MDFAVDFAKSLGNEINFDFAPKNIEILCSQEYVCAGQLVNDIANECSQIHSSIAENNEIPGWLNEDSLAILIFGERDADILDGLIKKLKTTGCKIVLMSDSKMDCHSDTLANIELTTIDEFSKYWDALTKLILIFDNLKIVNKNEIITALPKIINDSEKVIKKIELDDIVENDDKKIVISYTHNLRSTARLWKNTLGKKYNKTILFTEYPEFNHNEIVGWCMSPNQSENFVNLFLFEKETSHTMKIIGKCQMEVLEESGTDIIPIEITGKNNIEKNLMGFLAIKKLIDKHGGLK